MQIIRDYIWVIQVNRGESWSIYERVDSRSEGRFFIRRAKSLTEQDCGYYGDGVKFRLVKYIAEK